MCVLRLDSGPVDHIRIEFVVGPSNLALLRGFSPGTSQPVFLPPEKPRTLANSILIRIENLHENHLGLMWHPL